MSPVIEQTARDIPDGIKLNSNVRAKVTGMKMIGRLSPDGKKGRENWEVEVDGFGSYEVSVVIPAKTNNMKDAEKREARVKALVMKAVQGDIDADLAIYS